VDALAADARLEQWCDTRTQRRLARRVEDGLRRARATGGATLVSLSWRVSPRVDPSAVVLASRIRGEPWFCFEQPERDRIAVAGVGCVTVLEAEGEDRFAVLARRWRALARTAQHDELPAAPGAGLTAVGGFAFAPAGARDPAWAGFAAASLQVPAISLARQGAQTWLTCNSLIAPDDTAEDVLGPIRARLARLREAPLPLVDPAPTGRYEVCSPMPPSHFEQAVGRAVERIAAGEFEKVVLAREVDVHAPRPHDPAAVLGLLREAFGSSFVYAVGRGEATFLGATPELLVRRQGQRASTVALAGSARRSADPAVDDHLGEQLLRSDKNRVENAIVARRIARALRPYAVWVTSPEEPVVIKVANIQHLAAPIRAQLAEPIDAITLAGVLHPTPAVGAEPASALDAIPALEGFDRGWYAGPVGWVDAAGDGEFCVALRCALLRGALGRCYAGCGIVGDSEPAAELAETEIKLGVMLPALAG
jgi:isochorismate synthase